jgi:hypothetical protein
MLLLVTTEAAGQSSPAATPSVTIGGAVAAPVALTRADLLTMPRASATTVSNGISTVYEGVLVADVLKRAGVPFGSGMRGEALAGYLVATATDGYRVVFSLGELDPDLTDGQYLLADSENGGPLFGASGHFRLLVPKDKRGARSVRLLSSLTVVRVSR